MTNTGKRYEPRELDSKWQNRWATDELYRVRDDDPRPKWYELTMYPYPSGDLHIGHWYAMSPADAHARFRRMQGYNVLHPCLLYTSPSPRDRTRSRMPSSA